MVVPVEIARQNIAANAVASPIGVEVVAAQQGNFHGEHVTPKNLSSRLTAANKNATAASKSRDLHSLQMKMLKKGRGTNLEASARVIDFEEKLPNMPGRARLQILVEEMAGIMRAARGGKIKGIEDKKRVAASGEDEEDEDEGEGDGEESSGGGGRGGKADILAALHGFDSDVSHQYAALEIARAHFESTEDDPEFQALLDDAAQEFEKTDIGRDVRAGFAAALVATANAASLETDPAKVRDAYRAMLREQNNFYDLFCAFSETFDVLKSMDQIIETFRTAAGRDLASAHPSTDREFLQALLSELGKLKQIQTVLDKSSELIGNTDRILPEQDRGVLHPTAVAKNMFKFMVKRSVNLADARALLSPLEGTSPHGKVVYVNGLQNMHMDIPDAIFPSDEARRQQRSTLTSLSDNLVAAEERAFENSQQQND